MTQAKRIDDAYAIDVAADTSSAALQSICIAWHGAATGTVTSPLPLNDELTVTALRTSLVQRPSGKWDSHVVVSEQIFGVIRAALTAGQTLLLGLEHQATSFSLERVTPAVVEQDPYLLTISDTLKSTNARVLQLGQDVAAIKEIVTNALLVQTAALASKSNGHDQYRSERGGAVAG